MNGAGPIDNCVHIITPENIAFQYQVAGPFRRLLAYLIDLAVRTVLVAAMAVGALFAFAALGMEPLGIGLWLVVWFILEWFYGGLLEALWNGQTLGKRALRLRVLSVDGLPINGLQAVLRNVLRIVDLQPLHFGQLGLLAAGMNDRFQRLGDLACGTMVVIEEPHWLGGVHRTASAEVERLASEIPANYEVGLSMGHALATYVQRRSVFRPARRLEIAHHLGDPLRRAFDLPPETDLDLLLCALYHHKFVAARAESK